MRTTIWPSFTLPHLLDITITFTDTALIYSFTHLTHILETGLPGLKESLRDTFHYTPQTPLYAPKHSFSPPTPLHTPLLTHLTHLLFYRFYSLTHLTHILETRLPRIKESLQVTSHYTPKLPFRPQTPLCGPGRAISWPGKARFRNIPPSLLTFTFTRDALK